jgi:hypothetical protein
LRSKARPRLLFTLADAWTTLDIPFLWSNSVVP